MSKNLLDLANRLEKIADEIPKQNSNGAIAVASAMVDHLVWNTPVDTSNALSNWQVSLGVPINAEISPYVLGAFGSSHYASASEAIAAAERTLKTKKPGQTIYIVNNAPYIKALNDGSSKQVPAGFIERGLIVGRLEAGKIRFKFK